MQTTHQIAVHLHQVFFGENWTWVNLKTILEDVKIEKATREVPNFNNIALLTFHIHYYVSVILAVLKKQEFNYDDKLSFDMPTLKSELEWKKMQEKMFSDAAELSKIISTLNDEILNTIFIDEKYGTYHRNFLGLIEHTHYHLGQICFLKKLNRVY